MTPKLRHPSKKQAEKAAAALAEILDHYREQGDTLNAQRVTVALDYTRSAAQADHPAQRSQLMGYALVNISPRAARELLTQRKGGTHDHN